MRLRRAIAVPALLLVLGACGDDPADTAAAESADGSSSDAVTSDLPACDSVWVDGEKLPEGYSGCFDGTEEIGADKRSCSFGKPIVTFDDRFYAVPGAVVNEVEGSLEDDEAFQSALASCTG